MKQIMNTTRNKEATRCVQNYQRLQKAGLILAAIGSTVLALPFSMHQLVTTIATILGSAGSLLVAIGKILDKDVPSAPNTERSALIWQHFSVKNNVDKKATS